MRIRKQLAAPRNCRDHPCLHRTWQRAASMGRRSEPGHDQRAGMSVLGPDARGPEADRDADRRAACCRRARRGRDGRARRRCVRAGRQGRRNLGPAGRSQARRRDALSLRRRLHAGIPGLAPQDRRASCRRGRCPRPGPELPAGTRAPVPRRRRRRGAGLSLAARARGRADADRDRRRFGRRRAGGGDRHRRARPRPAAAGRDCDPLRLGRSHLQRRQHDEPCGDRHRVHPGRPPRDGRLVHERRRPAPAPGLAGVRRLRRPAAAPRPGRRRRDAARRFHPPRARCRHGRRRRHALHRRRHAARVPDLGRRLPRGRRGDRHDRRLGPGTHGLRPHAARARISAWRSALPSKPIPGSSGITMCPASTRTPSGKPP
jgi:hypothetical protein